MGVEAVPLQLAIVWRIGPSMRGPEIPDRLATCGFMRVHSCVAYAWQRVST